MSSIKTQNLVPLDEKRNTYSSGSAAIVSNVYNGNMGGRGHTSHTQIENLGRVVWLQPDKRKGIFLSYTRGLVEYDLDKDEFNEVNVNDERIEGTMLKPSLVTRTIFGPAYTCLSVLNNHVILDVLKSTFKDEKERERVLCHCMHTVLKNKARIGCSDFIMKSALSYVIEQIPIGSLDRDSKFFEEMGKYEIKLKFFKNYIEQMKTTYPNFGTACYVDSTPLPNDAKDNPFNALSSHGTEGMEKQTRLVLVLDIETGRPVWFEFIQGNKLDHQTIKSVCDDLQIQLLVDVKDCVLDAGYSCRDLYERYNIDNYEVTNEKGEVEYRSMIVRMPEKPGYPIGDLYQATKSRLYDAQYHIIREEHTYFAERLTEPLNILGFPEYAYVYLDIQQALALNQQYRTLNQAGWDAMTPEEKNYAAAKDGFFVLLSNKITTPEQLLDEYLARVAIEHFFKDAKSYLDLLPLKKWTIDRIYGKVLCDIISTIMYRDFRLETTKLQITMPRLLTILSGLDCTFNAQSQMLIVSTPNRQIREILEKLHVSLPAHIKVSDFKKVVNGESKITLPAIAARSPQSGRPKGIKVPLSEEQKKQERERKKAMQALQKEERKKVRNLRKLADQVICEVEILSARMAEGRTKVAMHSMNRAKASAEKARMLLDEMEKADTKENKKAMSDIEKAMARAQKLTRACA